MRLLRLRLRNYRGVAEREVHFSPTGVTVVCGDNEIGKSSMAEAIDLLFEYRDDSTHRAVRVVQPVGQDVGAEVEAEVETGPYHFTFSKCFHRDRSTTLVVHKPSPQHLRGREAHEAVRAMLDETLDQPLWRALRVQQGEALGLPDLHAQTSLAAALDEAAQGALGADREAALFDRVGVEYAQYFTPTGRRNAALIERTKAVTAAEETLAAAQARLTGLDADVARHAELAEVVATLAARLARDEADRAGAEQQVAALRAAEEVLARLAGEARATEAERAAAEALVVERRTLAARVAEIQGTLTQLEGARADEAAQRAAVTTASLAAQDRQERARQRRRAAGELARLRRDDHTRLGDQAHLEQLDLRVERAAEVSRRHAEALLVLDTNPVDASAIERIERAQAAVDVLTRQVAAELPVLRVTATAPVTVTTDGAEQGGGDGDGGRGDERTEATVAPGDRFEQAITGTVTVALAGGTVEIVAGAGTTALAQEAAEAGRELTAALTAAQAEDTAAARAQRSMRLEAEQAVAALGGDPEALGADALAGLEDQRLELARRIEASLAARPAIPTPPADLDAARALVDDAEAEADDAERAAEIAERHAADAQAAFDALDRQAAAADALIARALAQLGDDEAALGQARAQVDDDALDRQLFGRSVLATDAGKAHEEAVAALAERRPDELASAAAEAGQRVRRTTEELRERADERVELAGRIAVLGDEGLHDRLVEAQAELDAARAECDAWESRAAAAHLLRETLGRHRAEARRAYMAPLRNRIDELGRSVFGPTFAVELDETLSISRRTLDGLTLDFADLSAGTREQLSVLARLACATLVARDGGGVPVILDDVLGFSDPGRLARLGEVFAATADCQVIVLTCVPDRYAAVGAAKIITLP